MKLHNCRFFVEAIMLSLIFVCEYLNITSKILGLNTKKLK